jgi:lipopolysaccharide export system protein LptA
MKRMALALTVVLGLVVAYESGAEPTRGAASSSRTPTARPAGASQVTPIRVAAPTVVAPAATPPAAVKPEPEARPAERDKAERDKAERDKAERGKEDRSQPVTVDSDRMERFGKESLVIFSGNVVARQDNSVQYADRMEVYLDEKGNRILRTVSTGNVRIITKDCRTGTARRAEYHDLEQRVVLLGGARVWQDDNVVSGETITIYLSQDRSVVQAGTQERVKAVFFPKDQNQQKDAKKDTTAQAKATATACAN